MKTISFLLIFGAVSAFAQGDFAQGQKEFLGRKVTEVKDKVAQVEKLLPVRDQAFFDLSSALTDPNLSKVPEAFYRAWDVELRMQVLLSACNRDMMLTATVVATLGPKEIMDESIAVLNPLDVRLQELAKQSKSQMQNLSLRAQMFAYSLKESNRVLVNLRKAVNERKKAAEKLGKKIGGADKVKTEICAEHLLMAHTSVMAVVAQMSNLIQFITLVEYYFGVINTEECGRLRRAVEELSKADRLKWAPEEQIALYKRAGGDSEDFSVR